ncbi:hypothetical protein GCM10009759_12260 [Kitasatospora saccharophila]|uniref:Uncharacterized protein n=1 Tax=Kitasatospora saccharophila TaxID=407973 RepID=A0ABN2WCP6_9ACTN
MTPVRPVLRRLLVAFLAACVGFTVLVVGWGVVALTRDHTPRETDSTRAQRLAGLHADQHPGKGRYYVPQDAVLARTPDGTRVGYLHYRLGGGDDVNVDDFLRTYDLPGPGGPAPLPDDLRTALPGDEPPEAALLPEAPGSGVHRQVYVVRTQDGPTGAGDVYVRATGQSS